MKNNKDGKITLLDRLFTAMFSAVAIFITCFLISFFFGAKSLSGEIIFSWLWLATILLTVVSGLAGFILGSNRMFEVLGAIWGTNKSKDGNWL